MLFRGVRRLLLASLVVALILIGTGFGFLSTTVRAECGVYHTVTRGQTLFRISLRYGVKMSDIAAANQIANVNLIYVGQRFYIPCAGTTSGGVVVSGSVTPFLIYGQPPTVGTPSASVSGLDCAGFRGTSPDAFSGGSDTFYWDPPSNTQIARYQVRILNESRANVGSFEALAPSTSLQADTGIASLGLGTNFYWYVVGVTADNRICQTETRYAQREWINLGPIPTPTP